MLALGLIAKYRFMYVRAFARSSLRTAITARSRRVEEVHDGALGLGREKRFIDALRFIQLVQLQQRLRQNHGHPVLMEGLAPHVGADVSDRLLRLAAAEIHHAAGGIEAVGVYFSRLVGMGNRRVVLSFVQRQYAEGAVGHRQLLVGGQRPLRILLCDGEGPVGVRC